MRLVLVSRAGTRKCEWSGYALLRDNVQHFIEGGAPSARFAALHQIEAAVDSGCVEVDASRLRGEALRAWYSLWGVRLNEAAVSVRTRAILSASRLRPCRRGTQPARRVGWRLPVSAIDSARVSETGSDFISAVLALTERAVDGDTLKVRRLGTPPRFAREAPPRGTPPRQPATTPSSWSSATLATALALFAAGCSTGMGTAPRAPSEERSPDHVPRAEQEPRHEKRGPLVAPPPAYGNKVVLASSGG